MANFKSKYTLEQRQKESSRMRVKYPDRVPIILERSNNSVPDVDKHKYLIPIEMMGSEFLYVIQQRLKLTAEQTIFIFSQNNLIHLGDAFSTIYKYFKDEDGFLYLSYSLENTFG